MHRDAQRLAEGVPERDVDGADRDHAEPLATPGHRRAVHQLPRLLDLGDRAADAGAARDASRRSAGTRSAARAASPMPTMPVEVSTSTTSHRGKAKPRSSRRRVPAAQRVRVANAASLGGRLEEPAADVRRRSRRGGPCSSLSFPLRQLGAARCERVVAGRSVGGESPPVIAIVARSGASDAVESSRHDVSRRRGSTCRSRRARSRAAAPPVASAARAPRGRRRRDPRALATSFSDEPCELADERELQPVPDEPRHVAPHDDGQLPERGERVPRERERLVDGLALPRSPRRSA